MIAIGTGAEAAIEHQIRAAGMNLIVVTAGNYKVEDRRLRRRRRRPSGARSGSGDPDRRVRTSAGSESGSARRTSSLAAFHPEDDPMEKHDHPTARQRLGDSEAGLGVGGDAHRRRRRRDPRHRAACSTSPRAAPERARRRPATSAGSRGCTAPTSQLPLIRRAWTFRSGRFFSAARAVAARAGGRARQRRRAEAVRRRQPGRPRRDDLESAVPRRRRGDERRAGWWRRRRATISSTRSTCRSRTVHRLLNLAKLNDITITAASTGEVSRVIEAT